MEASVLQTLVRLGVLVTSMEQVKTFTVAVAVSLTETFWNDAVTVTTLVVVAARVAVLEKVTEAPGARMLLPPLAVWKSVKRLPSLSSESAVTVAGISAGFVTTNV